MDSFFRFSDYEVFAYLAAGVATIAAWDFVFGTRWIIGADWTAASGVTVVFAAYVVGQIVAWPAAWILERVVVRRTLGAPSRALFGELPPGRFQNIKVRLFPDYFTPLDRHVATGVRRHAARAGQADSSGEGLFWTAFARSKRDADTYARMNQFLKLYGFCRNVAFVGFAAAAAIEGEALWRVPAAGFNSDIDHHLLWAGVTLAAGIAMFYRYLKFHRLYSVEVFVGYADLPPSEREAHEGTGP
jgi:hypothetical protein